MSGLSCLDLRSPGGRPNSVPRMIRSIVSAVSRAWSGDTAVPERSIESTFEADKGRSPRISPTILVAPANSFLSSPVITRSGNMTVGAASIAASRSATLTFVNSARCCRYQRIRLVEVRELVEILYWDICVIGCQMRHVELASDLSVDAGVFVRAVHGWDLSDPSNSLIPGRGIDDAPDGFRNTRHKKAD